MARWLPLDTYLLNVIDEMFMQKAKLVTGGHMIDPPATITYTSVVLKETVQNILTKSALNAFKAKAAIIMNVFVQTPVTKKVSTMPSQEYNKYVIKHVLIVTALCGLKSAGAIFRSHLTSCISNIEYKLCRIYN